MKEIRQTFGNVVALSSEKIANVSPNIASDMNNVASQKFQESGLPKRFEYYKGRDVDLKTSEALDFVHQKFGFNDDIADFARSIKTTDLSQIKDNPLLQPKEAHVMYLDKSDFTPAKKPSFCVPEGMEPIVIKPGVEPVVLRRSAPGSNTWENALESGKSNKMSYESEEKKSKTNNYKHSRNLTVINN